MEKLICSECGSEYRVREKPTTRGPGSFEREVCSETIITWSYDVNVDYEFELIRRAPD